MSVRSTIFPAFPCTLAIDPGYNRSVHAAIGDPDAHRRASIHVFDEIYDNMLTTSEMIEALMNRPWWKDVDRNECVIDIQATARQQAQDDPPILIWQEKSGLSLNCVRVPIIDGIDRFRSFLRYDHVVERPGMVIAPRCSRACYPSWETARVRLLDASRLTVGRWMLVRRSLGWFLRTDTIATRSRRSRTGSSTSSGIIRKIEATRSR